MSEKFSHNVGNGRARLTDAKSRLFERKDQESIMLLPCKPPCVLSVDDDEDTREMLDILLNSMGIETTSVGTAFEALALTQTRRFDLYLLDNWLPDFDGVELCHRLREFDPHAAIVFYSGAAYEADRKRAMDAGASAYVFKPDIDGLIEKVRDFANRRARGVAAGAASNGWPSATSKFPSLIPAI
ncbi:MAG TPA: response regulator [Pyrinomonadaceae bacterium]|nr:response regulator [Pyrinomonadaceae bacterium]